MFNWTCVQPFFVLDFFQLDVIKLLYYLMQLYMHQGFYFSVYVAMRFFGTAVA